ncbi:hypothetical protein [Pseudooceanicola sp. LIPI14-2-Ac024]|uniref:hypothetical protein n=1 Tax=Pseudooceanicola sp. LIPI14-2-Ac024 TaxID=3344875 RepID=UPI0035D05015
MHLVVHAGFHKTGTSSLQQTLAANRARLSPVARILLKPDMPGLTEAARAYSASADPVDWAFYLAEAARVFEALGGDDRTVLVSSEDLAGHMPFRHGATGYDAAPRLMAGLCEAAAAAIRRPHRIDILFTTRAPGPWVASCHAQHLRATRITDDATAYAARALPHADLAAEVARIAATVPATVHQAALEDIADGPLGPLDALLDLADIAPALRAALRPQPRANTALPPDTLDALLALNRSDRPWPAVREAKARLIRQARKTPA